MSSLTSEEVLQIREELDELRPRFEAALEFVASTFTTYRKQAGRFLIRAIIPRDPKIKEFPRILRKVREAKENGKDLKLKDVGDIIGLKVLCPYPTDVDEVIAWMKSNDMIKVLTPDDAAKKESETGYRGYNFVVTFPEETLQVYPHFRGLKCEVQIKTMLQEAWDAWTHDVVYDPETKEDPEEGHKYLFKLLADDLKSLDEKSKTLKRQIQKEEKNAERRRRAAAVMYFSEAKSLLADLGVVEAKPLTPRELKEVAGKLEEYLNKNGLSSILCKATMVIGLMQNDPYYENLALQHAESMVRSNPTSAEAYAVKASICWARGEFNDAIRFTEKAIDLIEAGQTASSRRLWEWKGNFAYWVGEAVLDGTLDTSSAKDKGIDYMKEIMKDPALSTEPGFMDTAGFLDIVLGNTREEVDQGRRRIQEARKAATGDVAVDVAELAEAFFVKHECIALRKLEVFVGM